MRNGKCPKCDGEEIYRCESEDLPLELRGLLGPMMFRIAKPGGVIHKITSASLEMFVCARCGYLEWYVLDVDKLTELSKSQNWERLE